MFDWNEEEIAGIIWGDAHESDDHIVPYPKATEENTLHTYGDLAKKQTSQEANTAVKSGDNKIPEDKNDVLNSYLENSSCLERNGGHSAAELDMDSWPTNLSNRDPVVDKVTDNFPDVTNLELVKDRGQLRADPALYENDYEDKESGSFLDYSWANVGNFDDLDKIFRNNDSVLGNEIIGNADELWSTSADVIASPSQSFPMAANSQFEVGKEFKPFKSEPQLPEFDKVTEVVGSIAKASEEKFWQTEDSTETTASQSHLKNENSGIRSHLGDKFQKEKKLLKCRKKAEEKNKAKSFPSIYGSWPQTLNQLQQTGPIKGHASTSSLLQTFPSSVTQVQHGGPESMRYMLTSSPYMHTAYGYPAHQFPAMAMMPLIHSERDQSPVVMSGYNYQINSPKHTNSKELPNVSSRSSVMTPQEKIEKLRRRQQMQAMLAIKQQEEQLRNQVNGVDQSVDHKILQESRGNDLHQGNTESDEHMANFLQQELSLPAEQDDGSNSSPFNEECILEETIFNQVQDVIGKLELKTRLFIRDSLFRLARSAVQRQNIHDTSSTNKSSKDEDEAFAYEETNNKDRSVHSTDTETDTNQIDRIVAHLLFHRPTEAYGRPSNGVAESPISSNSGKHLLQPKIKDCLSPQCKCLSEPSDDKQSNSYQNCRAQLPSSSTEVQHENQFQNNP